METKNYILFINQSSQGDENFILSLLNIAGFNFPLYGYSGDFGSESIRLLFNARNTSDEIKKRLETLSIVNEVILVPISNPLNQSELSEVRNIFLKIGLDTQEVSEEELTMYIQSNLIGRNTHYIDFDNKNDRTSRVKIRIKQLQEHPDFKPEWIRETNIDLENLSDKEFTREDITCSTVIITSTSFEQPDHFDLNS
jgi:hypothetical protein